MASLQPAPADEEKEKLIDEEGKEADDGAPRKDKNKDDEDPGGCFWYGKCLLDTWVTIYE